MRTRICFLCKRELKTGEERFCKECITNRSTEERLKTLANHIKKTNSKYLR